MVKYNICVAMIAILMAAKGDASTQSFQKKETPPYNEKNLDKDHSFIPVYKMKNSRADEYRLREPDAYTKEVTPQSFTDSDFPVRNNRDEGLSPYGPSYGRNTEDTPFVDESRTINDRNTEDTPFVDEYYVEENFRSIHKNPTPSEDDYETQPQRRQSHDFHADSDTLLEDRNIESQMQMENSKKRYEENFDFHQRKHRNNRLSTEDFGTFLDSKANMRQRSDLSGTEEYKSDFDSDDEHNFIPVSRHSRNKTEQSLVPPVVSSPSVEPVVPAAPTAEVSAASVATAPVPAAPSKPSDKATSETLEGVKDLYS